MYEGQAWEVIGYDGLTLLAVHLLARRWLAYLHTRPLADLSTCLLAGALGAVADCLLPLFSECLIDIRSLYWRQFGKAHPMRPVHRHNLHTRGHVAFSRYMRTCLQTCAMFSVLAQAGVPYLLTHPLVGTFIENHGVLPDVK